MEELRRIDKKKSASIAFRVLFFTGLVNGIGYTWLRLGGYPVAGGVFYIVSLGVGLVILVAGLMRQDRNSSHYGYKAGLIVIVGFTMLLPYFFYEAVKPSPVLQKDGSLLLGNAQETRLPLVLLDKVEYRDSLPEIKRRLGGSSLLWANKGLFEVAGVGRCYLYLDTRNAGCSAIIRIAAGRGLCTRRCRPAWSDVRPFSGVLTGLTVRASCKWDAVSK